MTKRLIDLDVGVAVAAVELLPVAADQPLARLAVHVRGCPASVLGYRFDAADDGGAGGAAPRDVGDGVRSRRSSRWNASVRRACRS